MEKIRSLSDDKSEGLRISFFSQPSHNFIKVTTWNFDPGLTEINDEAAETLIALEQLSIRHSSSLLYL
jgi:hypothetical protein